MTEPFDLDRLLGEAADAYRPHPNRKRMEHLLDRRSHLRRATVVLGAAAAVLLMGSAAWAFRADDQRRLSPAHPDEVTETTRTTVDKERPPITVPTPDGTTPGTEPAPTDSTAGEPAPTEPKPTEPKSTEPKPTTPKTTEPKPTDPPTTEPKYVLLAYQMYGSCSENPPYDVFYGTTKPGAKVVIESLYSNRIEVYANELGEFEVRVDFFVEAPIGEPFKVYVVSGPYTTKFWFTHNPTV